jgi:hypothetical protein
VLSEVTLLAELNSTCWTEARHDPDVKVEVARATAEAANCLSCNTNLHVWHLVMDHQHASRLRAWAELAVDQLALGEAAERIGDAVGALRLGADGIVRQAAAPGVVGWEWRFIANAH